MVCPTSASVRKASPAAAADRRSTDARPRYLPVDEHRRRVADRVELAVQAAGRQHDEAVDLPGESPGGSHLLVAALAGVDQQHLEVGIAGGVLDRADEHGEVRVGDVGDDHSDVARLARDQATRRPRRARIRVPLTAASTRSRVAGATLSGLLNARDTVPACTPASAATSTIVARESLRILNPRTER